MDQLEHVFRRAEIAQAHRSEIAQHDVLRQASRHAFRDCSGNQHLPAMRRAHDAGGTVHRGPVEIVIAALVGAEVQSAADVEQCPLGAGLGQRELQVDDGCHRVSRIFEHRMHPVASRLHDRAPMSLHRRTGDLVVPCHGAGGARRIRLPQPRTALDVREQICH